jgi:putative spermidine/putrescine transport system substrate-binding protein
MTSREQSSKPPAIRRRTLLQTAALGAGAAPFVWSRPANAAGQVIVRTPGGFYEETVRKAIYDPFTRATGIEVVPVAATIGKLLAMFKAKNVELDVIDTGDGPLITLERMGALAPIDYSEWKYTNPDDIDPPLKRKYMVGNFLYATVLGYNTDVFPAGKQPKSWVDFWDTKAFPGPRMLQDMAAGQPNLEFALVADGVPRDKIFPIDIERGFKSMSRVKPSIKKFWDTGALSAQMLADKEVVAGSIWNGRCQAVIDKGAPLAMEWSDHLVQVQAFSIFKDAKNYDNAKKFIDFACNKEGQAAFAGPLVYGPANRKSYELMPADLVARVPGGPKYRELGILQDVNWWEDNRDAVNKRWSKWLLE